MICSSGNQAFNGTSNLIIFFFWRQFMANSYSIFTSVPPGEFKGRSDIINTVCAQLSHPDRRSTALVGGPMTGSTSLLRYMSSKEARLVYPTLAESWNIFISGDVVGSSATPAQFWAVCFREIQRQVDPGPLGNKVAEMIVKTQNANFDLFDLEDFFDACGKNRTPVVLFISDFINLLKNSRFWPPDDYFHHVRSLAQRLPRALSFVVGTPRPLIDLWDPSKNASPFYNIYLAVPIGRLTEEEVKSVVQDTFGRQGLQADVDVIDLINQASERQPALVNYISELCANMIKKTGQVDLPTLYNAFQDPSGPVVTLIRQIREHLSLSERQWLDMAKNNHGALTTYQIGILRNLWQYGLLPPGTNLP
jgi:hypothetical protein